MRSLCRVSRTEPWNVGLWLGLIVAATSCSGGGGAGSRGSGGSGGSGASSSGGSSASGGSGASGSGGSAGATGGSAGNVGASSGGAGPAGATGGAGGTASGSGGNSGAAGAATGGAGVAGTGGASGRGGDSGHAGAGGNGGHTGAGGVAGATGAAWWVPDKATTFYWDLANAPPDSTRNVGAYDIDGWNNSAADVAAIHARGIKVVCYMDAGTYEPGRPDSSMFPASSKGSGVVGWPGELWLDVRPSGPNYAALQAIMRARFQKCADKGFDAVEPDNLDSYANSPGFATTAADQLAYDQWLATTAHGLGLAVFQKNDLDQIPALQPFFDGILDEECNKYGECGALAPYVAAGKPAWDAEYRDDGESTAAFCSKDAAAGIVGALFSLALDGSVFEPCPNDVGIVH